MTTGRFYFLPSLTIYYGNERKVQTNFNKNAFYYKNVIISSKVNWKIFYVFFKNIFEFFSNNRRKELMCIREQPNRPFEILSVDICEYASRSYLVLVDHYSKWIECRDLNNGSKCKSSLARCIIYSWCPCHNLCWFFLASCGCFHHRIIISPMEQLNEPFRPATIFSGNPEINCISRNYYWNIATHMFWMVSRRRSYCLDACVRLSNSVTRAWYFIETYSS